LIYHRKFLDLWERLRHSWSQYPSGKPANTVKKQMS